MKDKTREYENVEDMTRDSVEENRYSQSWFVSRIWKAIKHLQKRDLETDLNSLIRQTSTYTLNSDLKETDIKEQILLAKEDGLISVKRRKKGKSYTLPFSELVKPRHDWYCFTCHNPGDVIGCGRCWRVYHKNCDGFKDYHKESVCTLCACLENPKSKIINGNIPIIENLTSTLKLVFKKIATETPELMSILNFGSSETYDSATSLTKRLLFTYEVNFCEIKRKIDDMEYGSLYEFEIDCKTILHNTFLIYGPNSKMSKEAVKMYTVMGIELNFIRDCIDCYNNCNKGDHLWFTKPCQPPHQLVLAKVKGSPLWPAKVIRSSRDLWYVWFFGKKHERSFVKPKNIHLRMPGDPLPPSKLRALVFAQREYLKHVELLKTNEDIYKQLTEKSQRTIEDYGEGLTKTPHSISSTSFNITNQTPGIFGNHDSSHQNHNNTEPLQVGSMRTTPSSGKERGRDRARNRGKGRGRGSVSRSSESNQPLASENQQFSVQTASITSDSLKNSEITKLANGNANQNHHPEPEPESESASIQKTEKTLPKKRRTLNNETVIDDDSPLKNKKEDPEFRPPYNSRTKSEALENRACGSRWSTRKKKEPKRLIEEIFVKPVKRFKKEKVEKVETSNTFSRPHHLLTYNYEDDNFMKNEPLSTSMSGRGQGRDCLGRGRGRKVGFIGVDERLVKSEPASRGRRMTNHSSIRTMKTYSDNLEKDMIQGSIQVELIDIDDDVEDTQNIGHVGNDLSTYQPLAINKVKIVWTFFIIKLISFDSVRNVESQKRNLKT